VKSQEELVTFARESLGLAQDDEVEIFRFEGRGSDRTYYRVRWQHDKSAIVAHYEPSRIENTYYADIALFLLKNGISVPEVFCHDPVGCLILMKDLGNTDLWSLRNESWEIRRNFYQKSLSIAHKLHSYPEALFPFGQLKLTEAFGPSLYRWERDYFKDNFVEGLCRIEIEPDSCRRLEAELAALAERLSSGRRGLVHRDLQSQNVMIYCNEPFLIDFQGMRFGTRFYDLGSILCDPYVSFSESERKELLAFYYGLSEQELDWSAFQNAFWEASAQRLMQALGAYGFLAITKGLKNYLTHVPAGIQNLRTAAENAAATPALLDVCIRCETALTNSKFEIRNSRFQSLQS
jgi:aminoglycoside/choline kinase family phosphotransferase